MVTFVSFFLWLMTGVHPVEVAVDPGVASVEILLDGESVGIARAPRWRVPCDFGERLVPHELEAVARDEEGVEVGRALQVVNMPRGDAEVEILFEDGTVEAPATVRVITGNVDRLKPLTVFVTLNGVTLLPAEDGRFPLPPYDPRHMHLLGAEAYFPGGVTARSDVSFGGVYGSKVATELTAVPIEREGRGRPTVGEFRHSVRAGGETLKVAAVDQVGGRVYLILDYGARQMVRRIARSMDETHPMGWRQVETEPDLPPDKVRFHVVVPNPTYERGLTIFPFSEALDLKRWTLPWLVTHVGMMSVGLAGQKLATAVALAGLEAAGDGNPRVVVLLVSGDATDESSYSQQTVREYLRALHVPLVVWTVDKDGHSAGWGAAEDVTTAGKLHNASKKLQKMLERQWIVWVEGLHLPNRIELDKSVKNTRLAG